MKADKLDIVIIEGRGLRWYASSNRVRRGFCDKRGSSPFWELLGQPGTGILAGLLNQLTRLRTIGHIFVGEKCDLTEIAGDAPQFDGSGTAKHA